MKKIVLILCVLMFTEHCFAQGSSTIEFLYDAAGNRISRLVPIVQLQDFKSLQNAEALTSEVKILDYNISVYPNPTVGEVNISINGKSIDDKTELSVYSINGSLVCREKVANETTRVDLSRNSAGVYLLRLSIDGQTLTWKIVKR